MKNKKLIAIIILTLLFIRCEKDESDYKNVYYGEFNFTVITENWMLGTPTTYDTIKYIGEIRKFAQSDSEIDLSVLNDDVDENASKKITIEFKENTIITSLLSTEGELIHKSGYHYNHKGYFVSYDNVEFTIDELGGLGRGFNYIVKGIRK